MLKTEKFTLHPWAEAGFDALAKIYTDPQATQDFGRILTQGEIQKTFERYQTCYDAYGFCRWALKNCAGQIIGTTGIQRLTDHQCLGSHDEIGWRLLPEAWGQGYATQAAKLALSHYWRISDQNSVLSYTAPDNLSSQAIMERLGLKRRQDLDFTAHYESIGEWHGWVWSQDYSKRTEISL